MTEKKKVEAQKIKAEKLTKQQMFNLHLYNSENMQKLGDQMMDMLESPIQSRFESSFKRNAAIQQL